MTTLHTIPTADITAVILAGGQARRMGGADKGLLEFRGRPLVEHVLAAIEPQVGTVIISANRNLARYRVYGHPVVTDATAGHAGPLAGIASGMQAATTPWILCVPCDAPFVPDTLVATLAQALADGTSDIGVAHDGSRLQQLFALIRRDLLPALQAWLNGGGRRVEHWYAQQRLALADFSSTATAFTNLNTLDEAQRCDAGANGREATGS